MERILGGAKAKHGEIPYQVRLKICVREMEEDPVVCGFCGGSLVSKSYVVTAAHCFFGKNFSVTIYAGVTQTDSPLAITREAKKASVFIHPNYIDFKKWPLKEEELRFRKENEAPNGWWNGNLSVLLVRRSFLCF